MACAAVFFVLSAGKEDVFTSNIQAQPALASEPIGRLQKDSFRLRRDVVRPMLSLGMTSFLSQISIVCAMAASMGRGCLFSALPVGVLQGSMTALATLLHPIMTEAALANLSLVGSMLVFCVGVNLIWPRTFKPANMLPSVVIAVVYALIAQAVA